MFVVLMREDSCGPIYQSVFEHYDDARSYFKAMCKYYFFCKLCVVLEENNHD